MKLIKKLFSAAVFAAAGLAFAQTSMTNISTAGLFGTDVDDFMNVNEYHNVEPENLFAFLGYGSNGKSEINFGLARQFENFYLGGYFEGTLNSWSSTLTLPKDNKPNIKNKTTTANSANGKLLFGIGNIGILADIKFEPKAGNEYSKNDETKIESFNDKFDLNTIFTFGMNLNGNNDKEYKTFFTLGLESTVDKVKTINDGSVASLIDNSKYTFKAGAGISSDYFQEGDITKSLGIELDTDWKIFPKEASKGTENVGQINNEITLTPTWAIAYEPSEEFAFKLETGLKSKMNFEKDKDYTKSSLGKTYTATRNDKFKLNFIPSLAIGTTYDLFPSKLQLNFGAEFNVPSFGWTFAKAELRNPLNGNVNSSTDSIKWDFNTADGKFTASSGFTWFMSENVTVDANWNMFSNLFTAFSTKLAEGNGVSVWNTLNQIFVHNFGFLVSVKF